VGYSAARETLNLEDLDRNQAGEQRTPRSDLLTEGFTPVRAARLGGVDDFQPGDRVRVLQDPEFGPGPWPAEPSGTVLGLSAELQGARQWLRMYLIQFDVPQYDVDGDGPYRSSEVAHIYLVRLA